MYPTEYRGMRNPTPFTTRTSVPESRSKVRPRSTRRLPTENQVKTSWRSCAVSPSMCATCHQAKSPMQKERSTTRSATAYSHALGSQRPRTPFTAAPASGSRGIRYSQETSIHSSELERVELVDVDRGPAAEHGDDDGEAHGGLGGGHRDDEEDGGVAAQEARLGGGALHQREPREGEESEVHRVEHQLDAHEDDERVAPQHHAHPAQREEDRAEEQVVQRPDHQIFPLTMATVRSRLVTSNGSTLNRYRARPTALTVPKPVGSCSTARSRTGPE